MTKRTVNITNLSPSQQVALWVILHLKQKSFYTSEVAKSNLFTKKGKYAIGGIMSSLYKNGVVERLSGGRDKLWKLSNAIEENREFYKKEISKVKVYWR